MVLSQRSRNRRGNALNRSALQRIQLPFSDSSSQSEHVMQHIGGFASEYDSTTLGLHCRQAGEATADESPTKRKPILDSMDIQAGFSNRARKRRRRNAIGFGEIKAVMSLMLAQDALDRDSLVEAMSSLQVGENIECCSPGHKWNPDLLSGTC